MTIVIRIDCPVRDAQDEGDDRHAPGGPGRGGSEGDGMKHLGDITKLDGAVIPVVDVITGGSPCQDLSIAGKREGLAGERSGLFMEQVRIVKEMRAHDRRGNGRSGGSVRPRFMVWENVPGAFSSNKGEDFRAVLEEIVRVEEAEAPDLRTVVQGGWTKAGCLYSDLGNWSVAWRVHDAQFWGVPQRRKRIALVADFGGLSAPEILFERKGLSWYPDEGEPAGEEAAAGVGGGALGAVTLCHRPVVAAFSGGQGEKAGGIGYQEEVSPSLKSAPSGSNTVPTVLSIHQNASGEVREGEVAYTIGTNANASGRNTPMVYNARGNGDGQTAPTITGDHENRITDYTAVAVGLSSNYETGNDVFPVLRARESGGCSEHVLQYRTVRRLTPLECERLQGYPDGWTDIGEWTDSKGKKHRAADAPRYKALGNSIALPYWKVLLKRISAQYDRDATLGSLFDGIGGFPYLWEQVNGKGSALWASEIEAFPIAVTKRHFPEEET